MENRIEWDDDGNLDEVVTDGGAHLERMSKKNWFLNCVRADGSEFCVWFHGKVTMTEERPAKPAAPVEGWVPVLHPRPRDCKIVHPGCEPVFVRVVEGGAVKVMNNPNIRRTKLFAAAEALAAAISKGDDHD